MNVKRSIMMTTR